MENYRMTQTPALGMPSHGSACARVRTTGAAWAPVVAGAVATGVVVGAVGAARIAATDAVVKGAFPGPDAWSPPTS